MTPEDPSRSRLAALAGEGESPSGSAELVAGARARTAQAVRVAARAYAGARGAEPWQQVASSQGQPARRWSVSWSAAVAAAVVVLLVGAVIVIRSVSGGPEVLVSTTQAAVGGPVDRTSRVASPSPQSSSRALPPVVTVHVVGAVRQPGVVSVPAGSRAVDAVRAAGGAAPDADLALVNLARALTDGEQVVVPARGQGGAASSGASSSGRDPGGVLDLNSADAAALELLPRIGPVLAQRIIAWRTAHGRFSSVDELGEIAGVGPALLAALDGLVRV